MSLFDRYIHFKKNTFTVTLLRKRLLYDISLAAHISSLASEGDGHLVADTESTSRLNRITESLDRAWMNIMAKTSAYQKDLMDEDINDEETDSLEDNESYSIALRMPVAFPRSLATVVKNDMHDYMVNYAIADWYSFLKKDEAERFAILSANNITDLKAHLDTRVSPARTHLDPF